MGSKKQKKGKSGSDAPRIPKRVAGVKLPKELRKSGNLLIETANSPIGREVLVSGLMAVIAGATARRAATPAASPNSAPQQTVDAQPAIDPHDAGARAARQMIDLIGGAATAALTRYRAESRGDEEPDRRD